MERELWVVGDDPLHYILYAEMSANSIYINTGYVHQAVNLAARVVSYTT
jgi:hypothetical protein